MLKPLLIEIGVEELPAVPLLKELKNIEKKWLKILEENSLISEFEFYYTPRRLVLWHREFKTSQEDSELEFFGAPMAMAYKDGEPTPAALGFAKKCGVDISEIGKGEKGGKEVLYYKKEIKGRASAELLPVMIEEWVKSLDFGKAMRWGSLSESFIRPIRWVNVMFDDDLVDMKLFDVVSSKQTYVHRISSFEVKDISTIAEYFETLKNGAVTLYPDERKKNILAQFEKLQNEQDIEIEIDEDLLEEVVAITEHPTALVGNFDEAFLRLPPEVIITSMKEHQRYFPVFKSGKLVNSFVVVSNALTDDFSKVVEGNEKVLRPRLADGLFFYDNDLKRGLTLDGLEKVVFMDGLGTLKEKIKRETLIAKELFHLYKDDIKGDEDIVERAITLAKADLMSEMVYEFTELQGIMGYYYALALGEKSEVALAIKEQYLPEGEESDVPSTPLSAIISMSIKLDTLIGLFSIEQIPTGSRDPFALRRAVNGIVRIVNEHKLKFDIVKTFTQLASNYKAFDLSKLEEFFLERLRQYYKVNPSIIEAVLASGERELLAIGKKIAAVETMVQSESFAQTFSTFKRLANITKDMDMSQELSVNPALFEDDAENELFNAYIAVLAGDYASYIEELDMLLELKPQLDAFFDNVMVNADDEEVRNNRKSLVALIYKSFLHIADIKEISVS
ncbi:glycine--tRNA ligase subunit beta [Sulfurimonas sp. HSL-1716]|uniref:glycine--tRNA ligase subunit beta n=1 Tax=Hydrocurvibacter sulfurireducens TaxID=3131937 RepID=UPI0031F82A38